MSGGARRLAHARLVVGRIRMLAPAFGWRRAVSLAIRDRRGATGEIVLSHPGYRGRFVLRAGGSDLLTFHQVIATDGYELPFELDAEPSCIVDAGANIGLSSVWYANRYSSATVIAVEPEVHNFAQLLRNVAEYPTIVPVRAALWPTDGTVRLSDPTAAAFSFRVESSDGLQPPQEPGGRPGPGDEVPAVSIPTLMRRHRLSTIDILKVDIEGAERELFEGDTSWVDDVDVIAIELHDRFEPGCQQAFEAATRDFVVRSTHGDETFVRRSTSAPRAGDRRSTVR